MPYLTLSTNRTVPLQNASFTIGSDPTCDLALADPSVAPRHLILQSRGDGWQMATLNLHASVIHNGRPVSGLVLLHDGDRIRVGKDIEFIWREADAPRKGPWTGLLLIFLTVLAAISILFAVYRFDAAYLKGILPITTPQQPTMKVTIPASNTPSVLTPAGISAEGHPIYHLTLPAERNAP